jgi:predicted TIM-barrel fold metal-dependent hydrolase
MGGGLDAGVMPSGGGSMPTASGTDAGSIVRMMSTGDGGFMVNEEMTEDMDMAEEMLSGDEFIFDVQTHTQTPIEEPWDVGPPDERALAYITQIFVQSETDVAVLSGAPRTRELGAPNIASRDQMREIIDRIGGPRLLIHGNTEPERGASELDYMAELAEQFELAAWKVYPHEGSLLLDSDEYGAPFVERARELGITTVAGHRGLWDNLGYDANASPADMVRTAAAAPDINFLIYHSGYERMNDEAHRYDPDAMDHFGVDRMVRALQETGIGPDGNVYAELGSTWDNIMNQPEQAAHVLGKLLLALGPDRILWGTDCVFNGIPQSQITAFRMFQIPEQMREEFGYPELTAEIKAKIFGLNGAALYGVDVGATRTEINEDSVEQLRMAMLDDPRSVPIPDRRDYEGPRNLRDYFKLLKRDRFFRHG